MKAIIFVAGLLLSLQAVAKEPQKKDTANAQGVSAKVASDEVSATVPGVSAEVKKDKVSASVPGVSASVNADGRVVAHVPGLKIDTDLKKISEVMEKPGSDNHNQGRALAQDEKILAGSTTLNLKASDSSRSGNCNVDTDVVIEGTGSSFTLTGPCNIVIVRANDSSVYLESANKIDIFANNTGVKWKQTVNGRKPVVSMVGANSSAMQGVRK
jgi:hypothetical protein